MANLTLAATDFRLHLPRILEKVAYQDTRVVVQRYGHQMVAVVSWEDFEFLEKHRPRSKQPAQAEPAFQRPHAAAEALGLMNTSLEDAFERIAREKAMRKEAERRAREKVQAERKQREDHLRWVNACMYRHPGSLTPDELVAVYREVYPDRANGLIACWLPFAWKTLQQIGRAEGLSPPPPLDALGERQGPT